MENLLDKASILITPTASNNIGTINAIKPENAPFGDLTFTRNSIATRVNESGLIENVSSNVPRIDYLSGKGNYLLEVASTNTATNSNDFLSSFIYANSSVFTEQDLTLTINQAVSPDGTSNASKIQANTANSIHHLRVSNATVVSGEMNVVSVFVKKGANTDWFAIFCDGYDTNYRAWFNVSNGTLGTVELASSASIEDYGNGWYRCSIAFTTTTDVVGTNTRLVIADSDGGGSFLADGDEFHYVYGLQAEASSNANRLRPSSYIPTSGSAVQRNSETLDNGGDSTLINSQEGVLYAELKPDLSVLEDIRISLTDGSTGNRLHLQFPTTGVVKCFSFSNSVTLSSFTAALNFPNQVNKIAIKYAPNDYAIWINGVESATDLTGSTFLANTLTELEFNQGNGNAPYQGLFKTVALYKEKLTDTELECLTS